MESLCIAGIQSHIYWENPQANYDLYQRKFSTLHDVDVVILPEMFTTGFSMNTSIATQLNYDPTSWMKKQASTFGFALVGSYMIEENKKFYNRMSFVTPDGEIFSYDKKHLFSLAGEQKYYTAGNKQILVEYKGWKLALMICYDLRFPVWCRRTQHFDYDALIFVANWPEKRSHAWRSLLLARAIENQAYVIGVNRIGTDNEKVIYSGDSAIIDPSGKYISTTVPFQEELMISEISKNTLHTYRNQFPFFDNRDEFVIISN